MAGFHVGRIVGRIDRSAGTDAVTDRGRSVFVGVVRKIEQKAVELLLQVFQCLVDFL